MFPWLWIWAPRVDFPLSGNVTQDIEPDWFFSAIKPSAGHAAMEQDIFQHSSYGKQLGLMMDVLLPLAQGKAVDSTEVTEAARRLQQLHSDIEGIKQAHHAVSDHSLEQIRAVLRELQANQPDVLRALLAPYTESHRREEQM